MQTMYSKGEIVGSIVSFITNDDANCVLNVLSTWSWKDLFICVGIRFSGSKKWKSLAQSTEEEADIDNAGFEIQKHINQRVDLLMQWFNSSICWSDLYEKHLLYSPRIHCTRMEMQKEEAKRWYTKWKKRQKGLHHEREKVIA